MSKVAAYVKWSRWEWTFRRGHWTEWSFGPWLHCGRNHHGVVIWQHAGLDLGPLGTIIGKRRRTITRTEPM